MTDELRASANAFRVIVNEYCRLIERADEMERDVWLEAVHRSLARVYSAAFDFPSVGPLSDDDMDARIDLARWRAIYEKLSHLLDKDEPYFSVSQAQTPGLPMVGSLADDLADVYADLSEGLNLLALGAEPADVIWTWRLSFLLHWGKHALDALLAIHHLRFVS